MTNKKLRIAVYAISKNEEAFIDRFCESVKDADLIVLADTGSTDTTVEKAKAHGVVVHDICISPWRFDKARDAALALVPRDIDICISLDLDEVMQPGWREEVEKAWTEGITRLRYTFDWGSGVVFLSEKIHARHGYHWHHPCHEYPRPDGRITEVYGQIDKLLVVHMPDDTKSRGQYMDLLELSVKEDPHCPRNAFYYARELTFWSRWKDAIPALEHYLSMPEAVWINERSYAMRLLGKAHDALGNLVEAMKWYRLACVEAPGIREPWCDLASACYTRKLWPEVYSATKNALAIKDRELSYTSDPQAWGALPWDLLSIGAWNIGLKEEAIISANIALGFEPDNERIKGNIALMTAE